MRGRDVGAMIGGAVLAALGAQLVATGLVQDLSRATAWLCCWCALLPLTYGAAMLGFLAPLARRITARGGTPVLVLSAAASVHVALTALFVMFQVAEPRPASSLLQAAAVPALFALAGGVMLVRACGDPGAGELPASAEEGPGRDSAARDATASMPLPSSALAVTGLACTSIGLALAGAAAFGAWPVAGAASAAYAAGAVLVLAIGGGAFARALGLSGGAVFGLASFLLVPAGAWVAIGHYGWSLAPAALGLSLPYVRLAAEVASRATELSGPWAGFSPRPRP